MTSKLAILLFIEFEQAPLATVLELLENSGGNRAWSEGLRVIIQFRSPTSAIVACESVLKYIPSLGDDNRVRFYIDTGDVLFDGLIPGGQMVSLGWSLLFQGEWNVIYFSESTRAILRHSEHYFLSRPEEWLEPGTGKIQLYRLVLNYSETRIRNNENDETLDNLSAISPASHGSRAVAGLVDFSFAFLLLVLLRIIINAPLVYGVISTRRVIEAENMQIQHGYVDPYFLASSGAVVKMGMEGVFTMTFPYEPGPYRVVAVGRCFDDKTTLRMEFGVR